MNSLTRIPAGLTAIVLVTASISLFASSVAKDAVIGSDGRPESGRRGPVYPGTGVRSVPRSAGDDHLASGTITVTNTNDSGAGSLRQAIADAAPGSTINFSITGTITLTSGQLFVGKSLTIQGPGANLLSISGNLTYSNRVFLIYEDITVVLDGMTIRDGCIGEVGGGIASLIGAHLTVKNSIVTGNCNPGYGAGIANWGGTLILSNSTVSANQGLFYDYGGGGIWNYAYAPDYHTYIGATLIVNNSTISNNLAYGSVGGGIYNEGGTMTITNSTIANNVADDDGGGYGSGGGLYSYGEPQISSITNIIENCTISGNASGSGGGLFYFGSALIFRNNIVSRNSGGDIYGTAGTASHNLIGDPNSSGEIENGVNGNIVGANPLLGPLRSNGGPTLTYALLTGSPAINAGNNCVLTENGCGDGNASSPTDQRGMARNGAVDIGAFERQEGEKTAATLFDFDGDGKADQVVFRGGDSTWYVNGSEVGYFGAYWGNATDKLAAADYDGDGKTDPAVVRDGVWWVLNSGNGQPTSLQWGNGTDKPVPADYDGDGKADHAIVRDGVWYILNSNGSGYTSLQWGNGTDTPVPADYDGDGKADPAIVRDGVWFILNSNGSGYTSLQWGNGTDKLVPADYDGDGKTDPAIVRDGVWWILNSGSGQPTSVQWGNGTDIPVPADYDGDGKADPAIVRDGVWFILNSNGSGYTSMQWGNGTDIPIPQRGLNN